MTTERHRHTSLILAAIGLGVALGLGRPAGAQDEDASETPTTTMRVGYSNKNDVSPPLREIPAPPPLLQRPRLQRPRIEREEAFPLGDAMAEHDPVVQDYLAPAAMPAPLLNFDGISAAGGGGCYPCSPDPNGEVGATQYVQIVRQALQVFDKTSGASLLGPIAISTLWAGFGGDCELYGFGDPVVIYDQLADRWIVSHIAAGSFYSNHHCMAISTSGDATGTWYRSDFILGDDFFDSPKMSVWPDAYYLVVNFYANSSFQSQPFAFYRAGLLSGARAAFMTPRIQTSKPGFMLPADLDGLLPPPSGAPNPWLNTSGPTWTLYRFSVDWEDPRNSTWTLGSTLIPASFTTLCSTCVPQLGTTSVLETVADRPMFRLAYRRFADGHEALLGNRTVSSNAVAGIRWWEINNATSGTPSFVQQGTYQPDTTWRWMGSIAMDSVGNLALGFSASDATINPQIRYAGRLASDPPSTLGQGEATLHAGTQSSVYSAWGNFSDLTVDPLDDCTFWYTNEYYSATSPSNWRTRIGSFKFPDCWLAPTFTLGVAPAGQSICASTDATYTVHLGSVAGFTNPVTLSATGNPAGTTVSFSPNPVTPPGDSTLTVGNTGAVDAGVHVINVQGQAPGALTQHTDITLDVDTAAPGTPTLIAPPNGAYNQPPTLTWSATSQATTYTIEIATNATFSNLWYTESGIMETTHYGVFYYNPYYYWRVRAHNACGYSARSTAFLYGVTYASVTLRNCPPGTTANVLFGDDFENGAPGWTHGGTGDTWTLSAANPHGGSTSYFAADPDTVSDQRLVSPPITIPAGNLPVQLEFWNWQHMETTVPNGCHDGGVLEISTDGGNTWTQIDSDNLLTDLYDGLVSTASGNPLEGRRAWCGYNPQPYEKSVVNLSSFAGQTVQFRFRLGSNTSVARPGWFIDDVVVRNCPLTCPAAGKGDFNQDSKSDLLFHRPSDNRNMVWFMDGVTRTAASWIAPDAAPNQEIVGADEFSLFADHKSDLLFWDRATGALEFWLMNGATRNSAPVPISGAPTLATNWTPAATGDFNADGQPDLLWRNTSSQKLVVWTLNGTTKTGNIIPNPDQAVDGNWSVVAALDYNNDGARDLLWYNSTSGKIVLWFMDANVVRTSGQFTNPANAGDANWKVYASGDYGVGSDGLECTNDIVWRNATSGKQVVWYMDFAGNRTAGTFTVPDSPATDPDGNPTPATDWRLAGPR